MATPIVAALPLEVARDDNALREIERALSLLAGREHRWELYERLATRAGIELAAPELWLLARLGERPPLTESQLTEQFRGDAHSVRNAVDQLLERSLVETRDDGTITLTTRGRENYEQLVAARSAGLSELLDGWRPDQHEELQQLVDRLGRDLAGEIPSPGPVARPAA